MGYMSSEKIIKVEETDAIEFDAKKDNFLTIFEFANFLVVQGQATTQEEAIEFLISTGFPTDPAAKITLKEFIESISNMEKKTAAQAIKEAESEDDYNESNDKEKLTKLLEEKKK